MPDETGGATVDDMTDREVQQMEAGEDFESAEEQAPDDKDDTGAKDVEEVEDDKADKAEAETQEEPKAPAIDARLKHAAERAGYSEEDVAALGNKAPDVLAKLADGFDSVATRMAELGRAKSPQGDKPDEKSDAFDITKPLNRAALLEKTDEEGLPIFSDEALGVLTPIFDTVEALRDAYARLQGRVTPYLDGQNKAADEKNWETLEAFFEEVSGDYGDVFGKGKTPDLDEKSEEVKARQALWTFTQQLVAGAESLGQKADLKASLKQALSVTQAGRQKELARKQLNEDLKKRGRQITPRPKGRAAKAVDPEEAAVDAIAGIVRDLGIKP